MIRPIDIRLNAAHPELPLLEAVTFTGAPSSVLIRGVPPNCGRWAITAVFVAASFPDGSTTTRAAVQSADGVWVATLPATATSGRTANGVRIMADGIDENGEAVTGYILGVADFAVASLDVTPAPEPGETSYQMLYFDEVPSVLHKGDVVKIDGVLKFYNGTAWEPFAAPVTFDNAVTRTSANGVKSSGIWSAIWGALSALPTGFTSLYDWCVAQLDGKASTADATLTDAGAWVCSPADVGGVTVVMRQTANGSWYPGDDSTATGAIKGDAQSTSLSWGADEWWGQVPLTATRAATDGYQLGSQSDKPLASEAEAEALRQGKLDKSGGTVNGTLAVKVPDNEVSAPVFEINPGNTQQPVLPVMKFGDTGDVVHLHWRIAVTSDGHYNVVMEASNELGEVRQISLPFTAGTLALAANIPYSLGTPTVIDTASSETVEGETVNYGAATLANRTANIVQVTATTPLDELRITFPAATSGKVRDFGLRVEIGTGSAALTAPALVPIAPTGETIKIENNAAEIPALADGTATAKGVTLLYFSETASGVFVVKGEQVEEVA